MHLKEPTTFEEQLELIKDKGFFISEYKKQECIDFLKRRDKDDRQTPNGKFDCRYGNGIIS